MKYNHWKNEEDDCCLMECDVEIPAYLKEERYSLHMQLEAGTWEEIMQIHSDLHNWGTYKPVKVTK